MSVSDLANKLKQQVVRANDEALLEARVGLLNDDGSLTIKVPGQTNLIYVRLFGQTERTVEAINVKVAPRGDNVVRVRKRPDAVYEVVDVEPVIATEFYGEAAGTMNLPQLVGDALDIVVPGRNLKPGRVRLSDGLSMQVYIEPFHTSGFYWAGGTIDLTSLIPGTANTHAWIIVGVDLIDQEPAAYSGTAISILRDLLEEDLPAIDLPERFIPTGAYQLANGMTAITGDTPVVDMRYWLQSAGADTGTFGNPNPIIDYRNTGSNRQVLYYAELVVDGGTLIVGSNSEVVILSTPASQAVRTVASNTTLTDDEVTILVDASGGSLTLTLPTAVHREGRVYTIKKIDNTAYDVTIEGNGSETIDGDLTKVIDYPRTALQLVSDNANWWII